MHRKGFALKALAGTAASLFMLAGMSQAQTFTDPDRAAADQYATPTPTPRPTATPGPPEGSRGDEESSDAPGRQVRGEETEGVTSPRGGRGGGGGVGGRTRGQGDGGVAGDRAVRESGAAAGGSLPFTGLNVTTIVLIGLVLAAGGLALRAVQRRRPAGS